MRLRRRVLTVLVVVGSVWPPHGWSGGGLLEEGQWFYGATALMVSRSTSITFTVPNRAISVMSAASTSSNDNGGRRRRRRRLIADESPSRRRRRPSVPGPESLGRELEELLKEPLLSREEEMRLAECVVRYRAVESAARRYERASGRMPSEKRLASLCGYDEAAEVRDIRCAGLEAREKLMLSNMRLVVSLATRTYRSSPTVASSTAIDRDGGAASLGDLVAEGVIGLATAVDRFEPAKGFRFSTYATWWIRSAIQNAVQCRSLVRVPVSVQQLSRRVRNTTESLGTALGRPPTSAEIAVATGLSTSQMSLVKRASKYTVSLDMPPVRTGPSKLASSSLSSPNSGLGASSPGGQAESPLGDFVESNEPAPDAAAAFVELRDTIDTIMVTKLKPSERDVLRLRLGLDDGAVRTRVEVGQISGQSVRNVRNLERSALKKLRRDRSRFEGLDLPVDLTSGGSLSF